MTLEDTAKTSYASKDQTSWEKRVRSWSTSEIALVTRFDDDAALPSHHPLHSGFARYRLTAVRVAGE